jgi:hypothetical protein
MDIIQLYNDFSIPHMTEGHKHCRPGWVNVECPFCSGNPGLHLGFDLTLNRYVCWRCGWHAIIPTLSTLLKIPEYEVRNVVKQYNLLYIPTIEPIIHIRKKSHKLPSNTAPMQLQHKIYLEKRGFDADKLEREWNLLGTGPISTLSTGMDNEKIIDFKHRIIAPIHWNGQEVSFQARDITGKSKLKYISCPEDRELIDLKRLIYGQSENWKDVGICVEGITDAWRFGSVAFSTFGIKYTDEQVRLIGKIFKRVFICFDSSTEVEENTIEDIKTNTIGLYIDHTISKEQQAKHQAEKLMGDLKFRGVDAIQIPLPKGDPGGLKQSEADYLVKQLIS